MTAISFARGNPAPECLPVAELADCARAVLERDGDTVLSYGPVAATGRCATGSPIATASTGRGCSSRTDRCRGSCSSPSATGAGPGARRVSDLRPAAEDPGRARRRGDADRDGRRRASIPPRSKRRSQRGRSRPSSTRSRPSRTRAGARCATSVAAALVELAREHDLLVLEDDPYGLVRFEGEAPPTLFELEGGELVIVLLVLLEDDRAGPARRLLRAAGQLARDLGDARDLDVHHPCSARTGHGVRVPSPRQLRAEPRARPRTSRRAARRDALCAGEQSSLAPRWSQPEGGYFIWLELPEGTDAAAAPRSARKPA